MGLYGLGVCKGSSRRDTRKFEFHLEFSSMVLQLLKYDYDLRVLAYEKLGIDPEKMDFLFGRPLVETIAMFGLQVKKEPDGTFFLTLLDEET